VPINSPRYRWGELDGEQRAELNQQIVDLTEAFLDDITHLLARRMVSRPSARLQNRT